MNIRNMYDKKNLGNLDINKFLNAWPKVIKLKMTPKDCAIINDNHIGEPNRKEIQKIEYPKKVFKIPANKNLKYLFLEYKFICDINKLILNYINISNIHFKYK